MIAAASKGDIKENSLYAIFANLFSYPSEYYKEMVQECVDALLDHPEYPEEAVREAQAFQEKIKDLTLDDIEGIYSYTFEMSADYTLDLGHHLYDGFKRSTNLLSIKTMYRKYGFPFESIAKNELPDHLALVLRFLDMLDDNEPVRTDFRADFLVRALEKIDKCFEVKGGDNIYSHLERALYIVIDKDVKDS